MGEYLRSSKVIIPNVAIHRDHREYRKYRKVPLAATLATFGISRLWVSLISGCRYSRGGGGGGVIRYFRGPKTMNQNGASSFPK